MLCDPFTVSPFRMNPSVIKIIKSQLKIPAKAGMRYNRNLEIRKKVMLFMLAFKLRNISLACKKLGYQRSYFYFWFNRLKQANFDIIQVRRSNGKDQCWSGVPFRVNPFPSTLRSQDRRAG
jgi:hypothetical protein